MNQAIAKQLELPQGKLGRLTAWLMSVSNREKNQWLINKINCKPGERLLEIGYGTGEVIDQIASSISHGFVAGIDHSQLMYEIASTRNANHRLNNKVALHWSDIWGIPYSTDSFDIIFGSNFHFSWKQPVLEFEFLQRFLRPGGRLVIIFQPRWIKSEMELTREMERVRTDFEEAGYKRIEMEVKPMKPANCIYIEGIK